MKTIKFIFSHYLIIGLSIILQFALLVLFIFRLEIDYLFFDIFMSVLTILIAFNLLNKKYSPDFKAPWLVLVLGVPVFGTIVYLFFSRNFLSLKQQKVLKDIRSKNKKYLTIDEEEDKYNKNFLKDYYGQNKYLDNTSNSKGFYNSKIDYYPFGSDFFAALVKDLKNAQKFIFMEYFIIERGIMFNTILDILKEKVSQGVEVKIIYDDIGCSNKLPSGYAKYLRSLGIDCRVFNKVVPIVSGIHNNRNHRKITVIDGVIGYIGGINLADEYIGAVEIFGKWKDTAVRIEGEGVKTLNLTFLNDYDFTCYTNLDYSKYMDVAYPKFKNKSFSHFFGDGPSPMDNELIGENVYLNILNNAKDYVYITTPYFIVDYNLLNAIKSAAYRGVDVRIITPGIPDKKTIFNISRSYFKELLDVGVKIYEYTPGFIHAKSFLSDDKVSVVGTINLDYRSLVHHYECALWMYDAKCNQDIKDDFLTTLKDCKLLTKDFKQPLLVRIQVYLLKFFTPLL